MSSGVILRSLQQAIITMLAALATMLCALAIDPEAGPAILAVVLSMSLSRSQLDRNTRGRLEAALVLPVVSLVAVGVGMLLLRAPWLGAVGFIAGMSLPIWMRRFGPMVRRAGSLMALPFVVILTTPYLPITRTSQSVAMLIPVIVALLALLWVRVFHRLARRLRWLRPPTSSPPLPPRWIPAAMPDAPIPASQLRPIASTRMAIQMAVSLATAFVVGYVFFAERWAWVVLTAYIVGSGNRGRLDVAYKSVLRVLGAAAGTLLALTVTAHVGAHNLATVMLMLAAIFLGLWLRPLGYAWWALFVTLALSLLQGFEGGSAQHMLWPRLQEIAIGAVIGVAAAWLVLPVKSTGVLRRRIADALALLADALDPATPARGADDFVAALMQLEQVAAAFRASRLVTRRWQPVQPADWVDILVACRTPAVALIEAGDPVVSVRRATGAARKAIRKPETLARALMDLQQQMIAAQLPRTDTFAGPRNAC